VNTSSNAAPTAASATSPIHELCGAQHPDEDVTCSLVKNPWTHVHVGHREGDEPLEQRTVTWGRPEPEEMTVTISLSSYAGDESRADWQANLERMLNRFSDEVFDAGGAISIGDCGRAWCTEMDRDGEGGEHTRHHVGKSIKLGGVDAAPEGPWWGYLLQEPGDLGFGTVKVVLSNDGRHDFELPAWQVTVLRSLLERGSESREAIGSLLQQATDGGTNA